MTVQKELTKNIYVGNGQTTKFPFTFECPDNHPEYIRVYVAGKKNELTATTNFGVDMANKSITYPANGEPLAIDEQLVIMRELPVRQLMNLVNNGPYFAEDIETAFDEGIMIAQQSSEKLGRALVAPPTSTTFDTQIPIEPGKTFRISDDGTHLQATEDPGKVIDEAKGLLSETTIKAEETAANTQEAKQANAEIKTIYNNGSLTPITNLAGSIGTALKRWGYIFANKVFAMNLPIVHKSVAEMKADSLLSADMTACTLGYYSPNDGGAGTYIIRAKAVGDVDDGGSLHELTSGLVAELVVENGTVCPEQFGAKGDGVTDDTNAYQCALNNANRIIGNKIYKIIKQLNVSTSLRIDGGKIIAEIEGGDCFLITSDNVSIENLKIDGRNITVKAIHFEKPSNAKTYNISLNNLELHDFKASQITNACGIFISRGINIEIKNCIIYNFIGSSSDYNEAHGMNLSYCQNLSIKNCYIYDIICDAIGSPWEADGIHIIWDGKKETSNAHEFDTLISGCVFGTCTKRMIKIQQSGVIVENCLVKEDATNQQSIFACYYNDIIIKNCTILGTSPMSIVWGVANEVFPSKTDVMQNIVVDGCYIVNKGKSVQGSVVLGNSLLTNCKIINNTFVSESANEHGIVAYSNFNGLLVANNSYEAKGNEISYFFMIKESNAKSGENLILTGNNVITQGSFFRSYDDNFILTKCLIANNIYNCKDVDKLETWMRKFILYNNVAVKDFQIACNIYPSKFIERPTIIS